MLSRLYGRNLLLQNGNKFKKKRKNGDEMCFLILYLYSFMIMITIRVRSLTYFSTFTDPYKFHYLRPGVNLYRRLEFT